MSDDGIQKAAILMLALGADEAAEVMKHLGPREVQKLGAAMSVMKAVQTDDLVTVLEDFTDETSDTSSIGVDSREYIREVFTKALGDDMATTLIDRILGAEETGGIASLKWMDSEAVSDLIKDEHPQIIATILVHLERYQASAILNMFTERLRNDVVLRIATLDGVQPSALRELNEVLTKLLTGNESMKKKPMGGIRAAADILNYVGAENEASVMENLRKHDGDMAQKIMDEMFLFENMLDIEDRGIQTILREVQSESLIVALKGANQELRDKIFKNMSQRAAEMLKDDLDSKGPVKLSEVETQQKEILKIVRRLGDEGQISIGGGDDQYV